MKEIKLDYRMIRETPDIETSSDGYASRFSGSVGKYLLSVQEHGVLSLMKDNTGLLGRTVLDVGGGHAQLVAPLTIEGCIVTVFGSDVKCSVRLKGVYADAVPFYAGNLLTLPFGNRSYDTIVSVRLISHMENWRLLVAELCRVADRTIIIDYPTYSSLNLLSGGLFFWKKLIEKNTRTYHTFWDREIQDMFAAHGFKVSRSFRQFVLPMALHRLCGDSPVVRKIEEGLRKLGVTSLIGNPVLVRLNRE